MKARDLRPLLEDIGCWPPKCHACSQHVAPSERIAFTATPVYDLAVIGDAGKQLMGLVHARCAAKPVEAPAEARRGQGAYLTLEDIEETIGRREGDR